MFIASPTTEIVPVIASSGTTTISLRAVWSDRDGLDDVLIPIAVDVDRRENHRRSTARSPSRPG